MNIWVSILWCFCVCVVEKDWILAHWTKTVINKITKPYPPWGEGRNILRMWDFQAPIKQIFLPYNGFKGVLDIIRTSKRVPFHSESWSDFQQVYQIYWFVTVWSWGKVKINKNCIKTFPGSIDSLSYFDFREKIEAEVQVSFFMSPIFI